jgi:hemolysin type calcium-binding protein/LVIVD repeat-containing protein
VRKAFRAIPLTLCALALASSALPASATHNLDEHSPNMSLLFNSPNGRDTVNSDQAFWGNFAYQGDYGGFRIFDVSNPAAPALVGNMVCLGAQNDITVFDRDGNGQADIAFTSVDRTQTGPNCGSTNTAHDDPNGWEGIRIFDISNPASPSQIGSIYQDCGSHTNTLWPDPGHDRVLLYNSSYPLRPGPTCGPVTGPPAGRDPLHGVIQVVQVSWNPAAPLNNSQVTATEIAEPKITYPGDPDNKFTPSEHGLGAATDPTLIQGMRACHDISIFVPLRLAAAACAEQAQLWRILPSGLPDTEHPIWVYDDTNDETGTTGDPNDKGIVVDFWHSATFSWDGQVVHFEDESFSSGSCPPETPAPGETATQPGDTGRMFFFDTATGNLLSTYMAPKPWETEYCSAHLGNVVPATDKKLLVFAWYMGGADVIDFTNPASPAEVAWYDAAGGVVPSPAGVNGSDNWSAYWYEGPSLPGSSLTIYATDGVHDPVDDDGGARGFVSFRADVAANELNLDHLNPQTQEFVLGPGGVLRCKGRTATLVGTQGKDILVGTDGKDVITSLGGNDRVRGVNGNDRLCLGKGKDRGKGGPGRDRLLGQQQNDRLNGGPGRDRCNGGPGRDRATACEKETSIP